MIEFDHVSVTFQNRGKKFHAVSDVTLTVKQENSSRIVGPFRRWKKHACAYTVNRLQRTDSGSIRIDGREITGLKGRALREERLKIGMIFQHFNLIMNADVGRNIEFALLAAGYPAGRQRKDKGTAGPGGIELKAPCLPGGAFGWAEAESGHCQSAGQPAGDFAL